MINATDDRRKLRIAAAIGLLLGLLSTPGADEGTRERAVELYDRGSYDEARTLFEQLDAAGEADGPLLYRLYYCQNRSGEAQAAATLARALSRLEADAATTLDVETPFYLANALRNQRRLDDMRRVASAFVARFEAGEVPAPAGWLEKFRLGKLYADLDRADAASKWYAGSLDSYEPAPDEPFPPYVRWAARYLTDRATASDDMISAERYLSILLREDPPDPADLDRLAVVRGRLGLFREAAEAWRTLEKRDASRADQARYAWRLAELAADCDELAALAPDGRHWDALSQAELQESLRAHAGAIKERMTPIRERRQQWLESRRALAQAATRADEAPRDERKAAKRELREARAASESLAEDVARLEQEARGPLATSWGLFLAAALEYVHQGYSIREEAFFAGYAPLIFRPDDWRLSEASAAQG